MVIMDNRVRGSFAVAWLCAFFCDPLFRSACGNACRGKVEKCSGGLYRCPQEKDSLILPFFLLRSVCNVTSSVWLIRAEDQAFLHATYFTASLHQM